MKITLIKLTLLSLKNRNKNNPTLNLVMSPSNVPKTIKLLMFGMEIKPCRSSINIFLESVKITPFSSLKFNSINTIKYGINFFPTIKSFLISCQSDKESIFSNYCIFISNLVYMLTLTLKSTNHVSKISTLSK